MRPRFVAVFVLLLSVPALAATRTWTGAASANWSDPNNWSPAGIPSAADALVFGSAARTSMVNDLPSGTNFGPMSFSAPFSLSGNALTLTQQAMRLFDALRNAGVYTFLRIVPAADHEDGSGTSATANEIDAFLDVHLNHGGARTRPAHH